MMRIPKSLKICGIVTVVVIISITVVVLALWFALLKPRQPKITTQQVALKNINVGLIPPQLNVTLGLLLTVENPNHASFRYENTTAYVTYRGSPAAQAPIGNDTIPARGDHDISTDLVLNLGSVMANPDFQADFAAGCLNFSSSTTLRGKAKVLKLFKLKATTYSTCDISVYIVSQNASSVCTSKFKY